MGRVWSHQLGLATSEEKCPGTENWERFNFAQTPHLKSHLPPFQKGCVQCSRKIYPFPTQMSFLDQLLEGLAELNPRRSSSTFSKCQRWIQLPQQPPSKPYTKRPWPTTPPTDRAAPKSHPEAPSLGSFSRLRGSAPEAAGGNLGP